MKIPIILITAQDDASTRRRVEKSGAAAHLWKPVDEQALLHAIRRAIGQDANPDGEERPARLFAGYEQALLHTISRAIGPDYNPECGGTKVQ